MSATNMNYVSMHLESPFLMKVHVEPAYKLLQDIKDEIKANSATMNSNLNRGNNVHLGFVFYPQEYTRIQATAYIWLQQPTTLNFPQGTSQHAASRMCSDYVDKQRQCQEIIDTKKALM